MNRFVLFITLVFLINACKNGCNKPNSKKDLGDSNAIKPKTIWDIDSIAPKKSDTANLTEFQKDSVSIAIKFQTEINKMTKAFVNKDYTVYLDYFPPNLIKKMGGREKVMQKLTKTESNPNKILSGPIDVVSPDLVDGTKVFGWYCLMPSKAFFKKTGNEYEEDLHLMAGQTMDGKHFYFMDIANIDRGKILTIMPGLKNALDIADRKKSKQLSQ